MLAELGRRLLMLLRRRRFDADLDEETRLHRELRAQEQIERGLSPKEAHYAAQSGEVCLATVFALAHLTALPRAFRTSCAA